MESKVRDISSFVLPTHSNFSCLDRFRSFIGMFTLLHSVSFLMSDIHRWKHAATCHHDSTIEGEGDYYYEGDDIHTKLSSFEHP